MKRLGSHQGAYESGRDHLHIKMTKYRAAAKAIFGDERYALNPSETLCPLCHQAYRNRFLCDPTFTLLLNQHLTTRHQDENAEWDSEFLRRTKQALDHRKDAFSSSNNLASTKTKRSTPKKRKRGQSIVSVTTTGLAPVPAFPPIPDTLEGWVDIGTD